jgi:hypothetical protein
VSLLFPFLGTLNQVLPQPQAATQFAPFFELLLRQPRPDDLGVGGQLCLWACHLLVLGLIQKKFDDAKQYQQRDGNANETGQKEVDYCFHLKTFDLWVGSSTAGALPNFGVQPYLRQISCTSAPRVGTNAASNT